MKQIGKTNRVIDFELIPASSWCNNLRNILTRQQWTSISKNVRSNADGHCEICGRNVKMLHAHETWEFDDDTHTQKLIQIRAVCPMCHSTIHIGRSAVLGKEIPALKWYVKLNDISFEEAKSDENKALEVYEQRSKINWNIDINENYIKQLVNFSDNEFNAIVRKIQNSELPHC